MFFCFCFMARERITGYIVMMWNDVGSVALFYRCGVEIPLPIMFGEKK